ncbi:MAG: 1-acyl-sn-glycerol-3-phosphate acyltransferase [Odoribacter sp.]|nr:1-acyl-sn-glycerol-3-phosphate acyltransferase [Odoribacter sp.]
MVSDPEFNTIRPYIDNEIEPAVNRLIDSQEFLYVMMHLSKWDKEQIIGALRKVHNRDEFQAYFFGPLMNAIIQNSSDGVSVKGLENLSKNKSYLFISNHRDIILDSAILNLTLRENGFKYTQAAIGSNLLVNDWATDLVKLNSCFVIERDIPVREMIVSSALRSEYIRRTIKEKENSVWIAQKEGRTKNGNDKTQVSLLKMFKMSGPKDFVTNFNQLHIVPLSISYEWEPCDYLKTQELYIHSLREYVKSPDEDMNSMQTGLGMKKGRISFVIDKPIDIELKEISKMCTNGDKLEALASYMDNVIHKNFTLWPNNYIAYDLLHSGNQFSHMYSEEEKETFITVMKQKIERLEGTVSMLNNIFLEIYANPLKNKLKTENSQDLFKI